MFKKLWHKIEEIRWEDAADPSRWVKFVRGQVRLYFYVLRELVRNRCPQQAAALTFTTLLSLIPLFAVAFSFFRGFAALEGMETKAQDAIFSTLLAGPLLEQRAPREVEETDAPEQAAALARMSPEELLAEADKSPRTAGVGHTLHLYVQALNRGADAAQVRRGMSMLRLGAVNSPPAAFALIEGSARESYLRAAGLVPIPPAVQQQPRPESGEHYDRGLSYHGKKQHADAIEALRLAEEAGYPPVKTRAAAAEAHVALGDVLAEGGDPEAALEHYRAGLASYCDALLLATGPGSGEQARSLAVQHDISLKKLGSTLFELGKEQAELYDSLYEQGGVNAEETLQAALKNLNEATAVLEHSSSVHTVLGELYSKAGQQEQALQEYRVALEKSREVAARGISLAAVDYIRMFIDKVGRAEIGILGTLFLLVTATSLLNTTERTLNQIWKVTERRPFWIKFTSFCTLIWLGPALIGASLWVQEYLGDYMRERLSDQAVIAQVGRVLTGIGEHVLPFLTMWLILVALYKFLPHTRVRFASVAWGALLSAALLHCARPLFSLYVLRAVRYERIYGSLGAVPVFLLWIWLLWMIVLFGAEVSFTIQNVGLLRYRDKLHRLSNIFIDRYLAARIMMYVAREFWETGGPVTATRLAEILQITSEEASDAAGRLVRLGLLTPVGEQRDEFHPARDLSKLKLSEVLSITDRFRDESRSVRPEDKPYEDKLEAAFRSAIESQGEALKNTTFRDLLQECEKDRNKWPKRPPSRAE